MLDNWAQKWTVLVRLLLVKSRNISELSVVLRISTLHCTE